MAHYQVLHVEDDPLDARAMRQWLSTSLHSFELRHAQTLAEAYEIGDGETPDVVLLDLSLPDGQGPELLSKARTFFAALPIIIVTGNIDQAQAEQFVDLGADDYLFKSELNSAALWKSIVYSIRKKQLEHELQVATELERRANFSKTEFLASVSHDLRTPLGVVCGYAEILEQLPALPEEALNYVRRIKRNTLSLVDLVNDLLDLAKVESGFLDIRLRQWNLANELQEVFANYDFKARQKGIDFRVNQATELPKTITTDRLRLRQILDNVVSNAIKFTDDGEVEVTIKFLDDGHLVFEVRDTGPGISEENQGRIFEPFQQADWDTGCRYGGTVLGLALARKLAEALEGRVEIKHSTIGVGSTFAVMLPIERADDGESFSKNYCQSIAGAGAPAKAVGPERGPRRVLVVDDNEDNQDLLAHFLRTSNFEVEIASNGREAIDLARVEPFDAILMDMQMPVLNGYDAVKALRAEGYTAPIVALTAFAMQSERERCLEAGCDDYLSKPVSRSSLVEKLDSLDSLSFCPLWHDRAVTIGPDSPADRKEIARP